jgi:hypothetical protein
MRTRGAEEKRKFLHLATGMSEGKDGDWTELVLVRCGTGVWIAEWGRGPPKWENLMLRLVFGIVAAEMCVWMRATTWGWKGRVSLEFVIRGTLSRKVHNY